MSLIHFGFDSLIDSWDLNSDLAGQGEINFASHLGVFWKSNLIVKKNEKLLQNLSDFQKSA